MLYHVPLTFQCVYGYSDERGDNVDGEERRVWSLLGLLYADDLVLCGKLEEDPKVMVVHFVGLSEKNLKNNENCVGGEEGL